MSQGEIQILFVAQENTVQGRRRQYTMQSSITDVCLSHAACTEQKSPQENTCTCTTVCLPVCFIRVSLTPAESLVFADLQWLKFFNHTAVMSQSGAITSIKHRLHLHSHKKPSYLEKYGTCISQTCQIILELSKSYFMC